MKYLGYLIILAAFIGGLLSWAFLIVFPICTLLATITYAGPRREALKNQTHAPDQNMILDGAFLLFSLSIIIFAAYCLGYYLKIALPIA